MFEKQSQIPLGQRAIILKQGMQKNVRSVGENAEKAVTVMQINGFAFYNLY
jgi:hypothetical protein